MVQNWVISSWFNAFQFGFATGGIATGSLKGALFGGISAAAFSAIGTHFAQVTGLPDGGLGHVLTHGLAGGILAELQGGQFGHGFLAAGLSKAVMGRFSYKDVSAPAVLGRTAIAATVGGTISRITGGKFANGALTAAMAQLFNQEASAARARSAQKACSGQMCRNANRISAQEKRNAINEEWIANNIPDPLNVTDADLANAGFSGPEPANRNKFHDNWYGYEGNRKYVHPDGYEIVVDVNNALVTHPAVMGTYNYGRNSLSHLFLDVVPYFIHGNSPQDPTTFGQRVIRSFE